MKRGDLIADRFQVDREAGADGMGTVYRAIDVQTGEPVAVKLMNPGSDDVERFLREGEALAALNHPRVVRAIQSGRTASSQPYLAMEWLDGEDLAARLLRGPLSIEESLAVARFAAEPLAAAHDRGLVHRDIKPSNIFLTGGAIAGLKLLDFGVVLDTSRATLTTAVGMIIGTPGYMAPEQARGERGVGAPADVFSLGCVLFECLAGRPPFMATHVLALLAKIIIEEAPLAHEIRRDVPPRLSALAARMLSKDPAGRPADGGALLAAIDALGASVQPARAPAPTYITADEQRVFSVILSKSTDATDATISTDQQSATETQLRSIVASLGGQLEPLANGALLVVVSGSASPTDLAASAARCALAMASILGGTPVALATGRGVVAGRLPIGPVIDQAARLLASKGPGAPPGVVRIDATTAGLLDARFHVRESDGAALLCGEQSASQGPRTLLGKLTSCVGRERELGTLEATFVECISEPIARPVLVTAPPGTGKTRLTHELLRALQARHGEMTILLARADSLAAGSPLAMAGDALRRAAGLLEGAPFEEKRAKLSAFLGRRLQGDAPRRAEEILGEVAGVPTPPDDASVALRALRADPVGMSDAVKSAWVDWLAAEADALPVVFVFEDLHWGDLPTIQLMDAALRRLADRPLFVLATARPSVHAAFPQLWAARGLQEIRLGALTQKASERLVREALGRSADRETVELIARRAEGHPFYLEELVRAVAAGGSLASLPDTVLGMLQGRLDALDGSLRRALRAASVFGERFWAGGVATLCGEAAADVRGALDALAQKEVIERAPASSVAGEIEYAFLHALVRDAAYAMLTDADRALAHRLAGEWLEAAGESDPTALASHYERGSDAERAIGWYHRAAEQALAGGDPGGAIERADRALQCGAQGEARGLLDMLCAEAHYWRGELPEAQSRAESACSLLREGSVAWFQAAGSLIDATGQMSDNNAAERWGRRAAAVELPEGAASEMQAQVICICHCINQVIWARRRAAVSELALRVEQIKGPGDDRLGPLAAGWYHRVKMVQAELANRVDSMLQESEAAIAAFERAGAERLACNVHVFRGVRKILIDKSRPISGINEGIARAEKLGAGYIVGLGSFYRVVALAAAGRFEEAEIQGERVRGTLSTSPRALGICLLIMGIAALRRGDARRANELAQQIFATSGTTYAVGINALAASAAAAIGDMEGARALAREAIAHFDKTLVVQSGTSEFMLATAFLEALITVGDDVTAREVATPIVALLGTIAATIADPQERQAFLTCPFPYGEILALAERVGVRLEEPAVA